MYCVIQKIANKKPNPYGAHKELIVDSRRSNLHGTSRTKYSYGYGEERFERPIRDAYKIMIHQSYREAGKVCKRQWVICTMSFYTMLVFGPWDCTNTGKLKEKLTEMNIGEDELWDMVYAKLDPIIEKVKAEFELTEEYRIDREHKRILDEYRRKKAAFEQKYGPDTYDFCYDIYGELRKPKCLEYLREAQRQREEFERSYRSSQSSNYGYGDFFKGGGSYSVTLSSTYSEEEKVLLKKLFRHLSKTFHPDITKDDGEMMKLVNKLKEGWGI